MHAAFIDLRSVLSLQDPSGLDFSFEVVIIATHHQHDDFARRICTPEGKPHTKTT
jgi:hypothetical protein